MRSQKKMNNVLKAVVLAVVGLQLGGCAMASGGSAGAMGALYTGFQAPGSIGTGDAATKQGEGCASSILGIIATGDASVGTAAKEADAPLRPVFLSIGRQVKMGAPIDQVMSRAGEIYQLRDIRIMSLAAGVNRRYGGSLRGVLKSLILAIRQRSIAAKELRALTAETRMSAMVLVARTPSMPAALSW